MRCCVPGCTSANLIQGGIKLRQYSFFRFPLEQKEEQKWRELLRVKSVPGVSQKICEKHFSPKYIQPLPDGKKRLAWNAIPTPVKEVVQQVVQLKRKPPQETENFYKVLEEYKRAKEKYFNLLGIPKEFEDDFDDAEYFGIHYDGLPWWARPVVLQCAKLDEDIDTEPGIEDKKQCHLCGKFEMNYDLHMILFHQSDMEIEEGIQVEPQDDHQMDYDDYEENVQDDSHHNDDNYILEDDVVEEKPEITAPEKESAVKSNRYMCSCSKILSTIEHLVEHIQSAIKRAAPGLHNLECMNCQSQFRDLSLFKRHIDANGTLCFRSTNLIPQDLTPLAQFKKKNLISLLKGVNSNMRKRECEFCGIMFPFGQAFMDHQRTVHGVDSADELVKFLIPPVDINHLDQVYTQEIEEEEAEKTKRALYREFDIPKEFVHDFDDPEDFGVHEGVPWWARPVNVKPKSAAMSSGSKKLRKSNKENRGKNKALKEEKDADDDDADNVNVDEKSSPTHTNGRDRRDLCQYCGNIRAHIQKHINLRHLTLEKPCEKCGSKVSVVKPHDCQAFPRRRKKCMCTCGEDFLLIESLHAHVSVENDKGRFHHQFKCVKCSYTCNNKADFFVHVESHNGQFKCEICSKAFKAQNILKAHMQKHTEVQQKVTCEICGQKFRKQYYCDKHIEQVHKALPVPCPHCDGIFKAGVSLNNHIRRQHQRRRDFVCEVCQRTFNQIGALKYHLTIHTGERNHPCPFCHQSFKTNKDLRRHYANHKDLTIKCPMCKNYFLNEEELKHHCNRYHCVDTSVEQVIQIDYVTEEVVDEIDA